MIVIHKKVIIINYALRFIVVNVVISLCFRYGHVYKDIPEKILRTSFSLQAGNGVSALSILIRITEQLM